jgi:enterochelin esterase-like enzyme
MTKSILRELKKVPAPLIEDDLVTFVWHGDSAPLLSGDFTGWDEEHPVNMVKSQAKLWIHQERIFPDAYIEYSFQQDGENILDPYNPRRIPNGAAGYNNYFYMPNHQSVSIYKKNPNIPHGTLSAHQLSTDYIIPGKYRGVRLYHPPTQEPVPLVIVWDGQDYFKQIHLNNIVDSLLGQGKIIPLALAFIDNAGQDLRSIEYACNDAILAFIQAEVLPLAQSELNLVDIGSNPGAYGVLGASMGGLMALYTGLRMPGVFGKVLSQSGAFTLGDFDTIVFDLVERGVSPEINIWLDVGTYDLAGMLESNCRMHGLLENRGINNVYREYHSGHNYPAWREDIWRGIEALFGANDHV